VEITIPHRANSLLEDYSQQQLPVKEDGTKAFYKKTMETIENHLKNPHNPLKWIITIYLKYFEEGNLTEKSESHRLLEPLMSLSAPKRHHRSHSIVEDVKTFTDFFLLSLYSFYNLDRVIDDSLLFQFNMPNLSSFAMTLLFRNDLVYASVFSSLQETNNEETEKYYIQILSLFDKRPAYFGVPRHLELMEDTIEELQKNRF
jgi:hypothetical protein